MMVATKFAKQSTNAAANQVLPKRAAISAGLESYTGAWGADQASHLLRRALFGFKKTDLTNALNQNIGNCVDALLTFTDVPPTPPLATDIKETQVAIGQTWVTAPYDGAINFLRTQSLRSWWLGLLLNQDFSLREKMTLFWHNHFPSDGGTVTDARYLYKQNALFRKNAVGNFKNLVKEITLDPAMLVYLNGNRNTKSSPNENLGREIQELFTIGKGLEVEAGNYTTYTEADVKAAARVLTGYKDDRVTISYTFTDKNHDQTAKVFSAAYGDAVVAGRLATDGINEIDDLLNIIFAQKATAKYICRKIYRYFVYYVIDATTENNVISPMADLLIANQFEIKPVLAVLFKSAHFYDSLNMGCFIKTPLDIVIGSLRSFNVTLPGTAVLATEYGVYNSVSNLSTAMQQELFEPPNVAGWPAYYQDPVFYEAWLNADTLPKRMQYTDTLAKATGYKFSNFVLSIDPFALALSTSKPSDINILLQELMTKLYPIALGDVQKASLKESLSQGLPDYTWAQQWQAYIDSPIAANKTPVETRLRTLLKAMMNMAEYQLC